MRRGLSLVELLVVIAIVAVLIGLLLPAVQRVRESANLAKCGNNLRQVGIAAIADHDAHHRFPSGGWGWAWVGMPDRGTGPDQPGGWLYNLLPYIERGDLRRRGAGEVPPTLEASMTELMGTPVATFVCPSRRGPGPYPADGRAYKVGVGPTRATTTIAPTQLARTDYAGNAGSQGFNEIYAGPDSLAQGDNPAYDWPSAVHCTGIFFQRSTVSVSGVARGTSQTFLAGERSINPTDYVNGHDWGDNEAMYVGFDNDVYRVTVQPPVRDVAGRAEHRLFGSAHPAGVNMLYCDGSVRLVGYDVDPDVFFDAGRRQ